MSPDLAPVQVWEAQREQALRNMARRGANIIVAVSFAQTSAVETVAAELPDVKFTLERIGQDAD